MQDSTWRRTKLENGAIVIERIKDRVLCLHTGVQPYVVWTINDKSGEVFNGYYHSEIWNATATFRELCKRDTKHD